MKKLLVAMFSFIIFFQGTFAKDPVKALECEEKASEYLYNQNYELAAEYYIQSLIYNPENYDLDYFMQFVGFDVKKLKNIEIKENDLTELERYKEILTTLLRNKNFERR